MNSELTLYGPSADACVLLCTYRFGLWAPLNQDHPDPLLLLLRRRVPSPQLRLAMGLLLVGHLGLEPRCEYT